MHAFGKHGIFFYYFLGGILNKGLQDQKSANEAKYPSYGVYLRVDARTGTNGVDQLDWPWNVVVEIEAPWARLE